MNQPEKRPVTLEDLLRLKRAERPAAEFWEQFDRDLRAKQLAAIMEEKPWWRSLRLPSVLSRGFRFYLPVGAATALALMLAFTRNNSAPTQPIQLEPAVASHDASASVSIGDRIAPEWSAKVEERADVLPLASAPDLVAVAESKPAAEVGVVHAPAASATVSESLPVTVVPALADTPSGRMIAANLAAAVQNEEAVAGMGQLYQSRLAEAPRRRTVKDEPLVQTASVGNTRGIKLLSRVSMASYEPDTTRSSSERQGNRLSDEAARVYDRGPSRIGGSTAGFNLKL